MSAASCRSSPTCSGWSSHLRQIHAPFGVLTDPQWEHLAKTSARELPSGRITLHYDPGIARLVRSTLAIDAELWPIWDKIDVPVLAIRGEHSDLLLPATLARMQRSGASTLIVPEAGHAPALMDMPTIRAIREFLLAED